MKTLYIHIGTPKTGTSAIQEFIYINREHLSELGCIYKRMPYKDYSRMTDTEDEEGNIVVREAMGHPSGYRNGFFLHGKTYGSYREENIKRLSEGLSIVESWFSEGSKALLTDERIWTSYELWDYPERIRSFAESKDITVKIILFLRPQYDFIDSHYRENVKAHYQCCSFEEYAGKENLMSRVFCLDYEKRVRDIAKDFGKNNLIIIPYEPSVWKKQGDNIFSVFLRSLGIDSIEGFKLPPKKANESLSYNQTEILRVMNKLVDTEEPYALEFSRFIKNIGLYCTSVHPDTIKYAYMSDENKRKFMDKFREGNDWIAKEFVGREFLFADDMPSAELWTAGNNDMMEDIILYFGTMMKQLFEINEEKKQHSVRGNYEKLCRSLHRLKK